LIGKIKATKKDVSFRIERLDLMSSEILKQNLNNPDKYVSSFANWKYPKLLGSSKWWKIHNISNRTDWLLRDNLWEKITSQENPVDFIIQNWEIKFGSSHSWISKKKNVDYAWEIYTDSSWKIISINNNSGHYKPTMDWFKEAMKLLDVKVWKVSHLFNKKY